jgi:hypothetical protein
MFQIYLDLQILMFSSFFDSIMKLPKPDTSVSQTGQSGLPNLAKFGHQHTATICVLITKFGKAGKTGLSDLPNRSIRF